MLFFSSNIYQMLLWSIKTNKVKHFYLHLACFLIYFKINISMIGGQWKIHRNSSCCFFPYKIKNNQYFLLKRNPFLVELLWFLDSYHNHSPLDHLHCKSIHIQTKENLLHFSCWCYEFKNGRKKLIGCYSLDFFIWIPDVSRW